MRSDIHISTPSRSCLTPLGSNFCASPPSRYLYHRLNPIYCTYHLPSGWETCLSSPSCPFTPPAITWYSCLISIKVPCHFNQDTGNCISATSMSISSPSRYRYLNLTSIQVLRLLHLGPIICSSLLSRSGSPPTWLRELQLSFVQVPYHTHQILMMCLKSARVTPNLHPTPDTRLSTPSRSHFTSIEVPWIASQIHLGPISPLAWSWNMHFSHTLVPSDLHSGH